MYNDSYYSRRGRTIERKKVDSGQVINPRLIPIYYNYLKDNGMFPAPPPAPPVHVDDGTCVAVDYSPAQSYSFPEVKTSLTDVLSTLLYNLGIDVDITKVDHIILSFKVTSSQGANQPVLYFYSSSGSSRMVILGTFNGSTADDNPYELTFSRDYSQSGTDFYCRLLFDSNTSSNYRYSIGIRCSSMDQIETSDVHITRIVVATLTE